MNFKKSDSGTRMPIVIILVTVVAGFLWYQSMYSKKQESLNQLKSEYEKLSQEYEKAKQQTTNVEQLKLDYEQIKLKWLALKEQVPMTKELSSFVDAVQSVAVESGCQIKKIRLQPKIIYEDWERNQYQIELMGGFHQIASFVSKISKLKRIVTVEYVELIEAGSIFEDPSRVSGIILLAISNFTKEPQGLNINAPPVNPASTKPDEAESEVIYESD
jgi:type IV pilus assembly protein PilO